METLVSWALFLAIRFVLPCLFVWGLLRSYKTSKPFTIPYGLSLAGFVLALASQMLDLASVAYAREIGGFAYYAPELMRIYRRGTILALSGLLFAIGGLWRENPLRWHALACSLGMLFSWFAAGMAE
jgi:hypothetical protein